MMTLPFWTPPSCRTQSRNPRPNRSKVTMRLIRPSLGANGATPTLDNFADMVASFEAANADRERAVWFMAPRTWATVRKIKDTQSRYQLSPVPSTAEDRSLFGLPVRTTTNIPITETVGTSTDCSHVLLTDMSQVVVARARDVSVELSRDYAFNADQTAVRVVARFDINLMQPLSTVLMTGARP
jgi:HK97 family phage major capsid protein